MQTFTQIFNCKYPIAVMAMNRVSDVNLAVACSIAGILPSLSIFNYYVAPNTLGIEKAKLAIEEFNLLTNSAPLLLSVAVDTIVDDDSFQLLVDCKVKVIELVLDAPNEIEITNARTVKRNLRIKELRESGVLVFSKVLDVIELDNNSVEQTLLDGIILKGPDAAGRVVDDGTSLIDRIKKCKQLYPSLHIIASGGIGTSEQIQQCIDAGAIGVGLGTAFAASTECAISLETKLKIVGATADDIKKLKNGAKQHALIFKELQTDVNNNTHGLSAGIKNPTVGHVFAGKGVNYITAIKSVKDIVTDLITALHN